MAKSLPPAEAPLDPWTRRILVRHMEVDGVNDGEIREQDPALLPFML
ncbi:MAG TPA: hypothetical protein VFM85_01835 [Actinomycetota bacterium]|nr:hypothetical protein [Actinomycetota bacterium]